jgi:xyloglucan galactosyltransferase MUR3
MKFLVLIFLFLILQFKDSKNADTETASKSKKSGHIISSIIATDSQLNPFSFQKKANGERKQKSGCTNCTHPSHEVNSSSISTLKSVTKKLFYMYDLPEEFWWRWPKNGTDTQCKENGYLGVEHAQYSGIGMPIKPEEGLFLTWHFSMFNSLFNRLKRSSRRTKDPEKASLFIIPYDIGLDGYLNPANCGNRRQCSDGLVGKLGSLLNEKPYFQRYNGADHVILWSLGQYHPWPRAGCDIFMKNTCEKCTLTCYWMDPTKPDNRFVSMPFPAAYHWWDGIKRLPWDPSRASERNLTAVYLGSTLTLNPIHTKIRRAMVNQCNQTSTHCHWMKIAHSSIDQTIGDLLSIYQRATFCLCPPGDDPARKAVFDAIVSGCIPVIFEVATLYNQYPWHIGEQAALDITIYIPGHLVRQNKIDFMKVLLNISPDIIRKKQLAIAEVAPRVQYAIPPSHLLRDKYDETTWDPPFHDAAEIAIDGFFERSERIMKNESTHIPHRLMSGRDWGQQYETVKIQAPSGPVIFGEEINGLPYPDIPKFRTEFYQNQQNYKPLQVPLKTNFTNLAPLQSDMNNDSSTATYSSTIIENELTTTLTTLHHPRGNKHPKHHGRHGSTTHHGQNGIATVGTAVHHGGKTVMEAPGEEENREIEKNIVT